MSFGGTKKGPPDPAWKQFVLSGLSGCSAASCTHPFDTVKVRMQLASMGAKGESDGLMTTATKLINNEGFMALYKGLSASLLRQATYTTTRLGLYLQIKDAMAKRKPGEPPLYMKIGMSMLAGAGGAVVGSPADVVLVRMQADGKKPPESRLNYRNAIDGLFRIAKEEGVPALWKGCGPNLNRAMLMTAGQVASYDQAKYSLLQTKFFKDNVVTHFTASFIAAFVASVVTSPFDVVKTRIMNQRKGDGVQYKNAIECGMNVLRNEGALGFYKGFMPYFLRLGPHTILTFVFFEQFVKLFRVFGK